MYWSRHRLSRGTIFAFLLALSAISLALPPRFGDALKSAAQLLVPAQDLFYSAAHRAARSIARLDKTSPAPPPEELLAELASCKSLIEQLQTDKQRLQDLRARQIPPGVPLLSAHIVARDIAAWRESALVARGYSSGVAWKDWVATRFLVDQGRAAQVESGQAVLTQQCLLGRVEQVSPYMARVQLLTDVDSPRIEVRIADAHDAQLLDYACSLHGLGRGRMVIENVEYRYVEQSSEPASRQRRIRVGDLVLTAPNQLGLPVPMPVGRIVELKQDPRKRLVFNLVVEPLADIASLRDVFIIPLVPSAALPMKDS